MILVDSSIWINHFRREIPELSDRLRRRNISIHAFVVGELALGHLPNAARVIASLLDLPQVLVASPNEVLRLIADSQLSGSGIGYVDAHLLAASRLTPETRLWTRDKRLRRIAERLRIAADLD